MFSEKTDEESADKKRLQPYRVRLPGFILEEEIGLGDVIKRVTYKFGIKPCTSCERCATMLNRRIVFIR